MSKPLKRKEKNGGKAVFGMARGAAFLLSVRIPTPLEAQGAADPADPDRGGGRLHGDDPGEKHRSPESKANPHLRIFHQREGDTDQRTEAVEIRGRAVSHHQRHVKIHPYYI